MSAFRAWPQCVWSHSVLHLLWSDSLNSVLFDTSATFCQGDPLWVLSVSAVVFRGSLSLSSNPWSNSSGRQIWRRVLLWIRMAAALAWGANAVGAQKCNRAVLGAIDGAKGWRHRRSGVPRHFEVRIRVVARVKLRIQSARTCPKATARRFLAPQSGGQLRGMSDDIVLNAIVLKCTLYPFASPALRSPSHMVETPAYTSVDHFSDNWSLSLMESPRDLRMQPRSVLQTTCSCLAAHVANTFGSFDCNGQRFRCASKCCVAGSRSATKFQILHVRLVECLLHIASFSSKHQLCFCKTVIALGSLR